MAREEAEVRHRWVLGAIFALGALLRAALTWRNPPFNGWDNHFEPVLLMLTGGSIPPKFACFQCYHPPVFYLASAAVAWVVSAAGIAGETGLKALQYLNCAFGVAALLVVMALIQKLPLSRGTRTLAALVVAVFPRHIYLSAVHGNDGLAVLLVSLVAWMLVTLGDGRRSVLRYAALGAAASFAIFTKYNALIVLPGIAFGLAALPAFRDPAWRRSAAARAMLALGAPALLLALSMASNVRAYGSPLPGGDEYVKANPAVENFLARQPRDRPDVDFIRFSPWRFVAHPLLRPGQLSEFSTLMNASLWFDNDAKILQLLAPEEWRRGYYLWLRGDLPFAEGDPGSSLRLALWIGTALEALGLGALMLGFVGLAALLRAFRRGRGPPAAGALLVMASFNLLGIAYWASRVPVYSAMKGAFVLPSMAAMALLVAYGYSAIERQRVARWAALGGVGALAVLVVVHISQLVISPV